MGAGFVYLDNASTSFPKPDSLWEAARGYLSTIGVSPGRGSYGRARRAEELVDETRSLMARLFKIPTPAHIAFTSNATHALNIAIKGVLFNGGHAVTTNLEHNSVLRPLESMKRSGRCDYTVVHSSPDSRLSLVDFEAAIRPETKLIVLNHASNVTGAVTPVREVAAMARRYGCALLLDASQTAGYLDIDVEVDQVDMLAFTGHKFLYGPSGTGGLYVREPELLQPLLDGATGRSSESLRQPAVMPGKLEVGTVNYMGIAGLKAVVESIDGSSMARLRASASELVAECLVRLKRIDGVTVYDVHPEVERVPVVSLNMDGFFPGELCAALDEEFGIMVRAGLHCAPLVHQTLGTAPHGTLRLSMGKATTIADIEDLVDALTRLRDRTAA